MDAILISFAICVLGVMVTVLLFAIAMRPGEEDEADTSDDASNSEARPDPSAENFFMDATSDPTSGPGTPSDRLHLDLERHVRTEHAAAEAFLRGPSHDSLHAPSDSPLWH